MNFYSNDFNITSSSLSLSVPAIDGKIVDVTCLNDTLKSSTTKGQRVLLDFKPNTKGQFCKLRITEKDIPLFGATQPGSEPESKQSQPLVAQNLEVSLEVSSEGSKSLITQPPKDGRKSVLSIGIPDISAIRVLNSLPDGIEFDIYSGTGFGGVLALLLAAGMPVSDLKRAINDSGHYITKRGVTSYIRSKLGLSDPRNRFAHLVAFIKSLNPAYEGMKIEDLKGDVFFQLANVSNVSVSVGSITKATAGRLSLLQAAQCIAASMQDYEPLIIKDPLPVDVAPLQSPGTIWNGASFGNVLPDVEIASKHDFKNLHFISFIAPVAPSEIPDRELSRSHRGFAHVRAYEIAMSQQAEATAKALRRVPGIEYNINILASLPYQGEATRREIAMMLNSQPVFLTA